MCLLCSLLEKNTAKRVYLKQSDVLAHVPYLASQDLPYVYYPTLIGILVRRNGRRQ